MKMTQSGRHDDFRARIAHLPSIIEVIPKMSGSANPPRLSDPLFVTGLPLEWRSHNGRYNPIKNYKLEKIDVQWTCTHETYWGFKICPMIIEYDHFLQKWTLTAYHADLGWHPVFEGKVPYGVTNHPCFAQWPDGISVSTNEATFWKTL